MTAVADNRSTKIDGRYWPSDRRRPGETVADWCRRLDTYPTTPTAAEVPRARTRLTKAGDPTMGTDIEIRLTDGTYEPCKVVGKGIGRDGRTVVLLIVEWADGTRQNIPDYPNLEWRAIR